MRRTQRIRWWLMREPDRLSEARQCDQFRKLDPTAEDRQRLRATERV